MAGNWGEFEIHILPIGIISVVGSQPAGLAALGFVGLIKPPKR
jgi:hypothetical protein